MTCREAIAFLIDYLEGDLPLAERRQFDHHLEVCEACRAYLRTYADVVRLGRAIGRDPSADATEEMPEELVLAIMSTRSRQT